MNEAQKLIVGYGAFCALFGVVAGFGIGMTMQFQSDQAFLEAHSEPQNNLISFGGDYYQVQKYNPYIPLNMTDFINNITLEK